MARSSIGGRCEAGRVTNRLRPRGGLTNADAVAGSIELRSLHEHSYTTPGSLAKALGGLTLLTRLNPKSGCNVIEHAFRCRASTTSWALSHSAALVRKLHPVPVRCRCPSSARRSNEW